MMSLKDKRILFFAPSFFGYEKKIAEKMEELGAIVDLYDERSVTKPIEKAMLKISPKIFKSKTYKYFNNIINEIKETKYDFIFVIKCEMLPADIIDRLREMYPNAEFCLYLYDSLKNIKGIHKKLQKFDRVLSFDLNDVKAYKYIIFRPLFYLDSYKRDIKKEIDYKYDVSFIGTIHSDRFAIIKTVKEVCHQRGMKYYFYCYLQSKFMFNYFRITKKEFKDTVKEDFCFNKISSSGIAEIVENSRTVLDIQHPKQSGLTMRTIEMLGMNKKLMTTNANIKEYDFYNPNNILIIDRNNVIIPNDFLITPYQKLNSKIFSKYSLENWIYDVLGCKG